MPYFVYILRTSKNTLYTGQTNDLDKRLHTHKNKLTGSAKYLRQFTSIELVYTEQYETLGQALRREAEIKKFSKKKKEQLINSYR